MTDYSTRLIVAQNLRLIRLVRNLSRQAMAELVGLDSSYLGGIERGERNVSLGNLEKLVGWADAGSPTRSPLAYLAAVSPTCSLVHHGAEIAGPGRACGSDPRSGEQRD